MSERIERKLIVYYRADSEEQADALGIAAMDAVETALGCTDDPDHVCPHFQVAVVRPVRGSRRRAIRCALIDLWAAVGRGELT